MKNSKFNKIADEFSSTIIETKQYIRAPLFSKLIGNIKNKSVADLGCGDGFFTRILAQSSPKRIVGVDYSKELIKKAIQKEKSLKQNIVFLLKDIRNLDLKENFDLISSVYLLNYAKTKKDLFLMAKSIYKHLKKNGKFCAIVPHPNIKSMRKFEYGRKITFLNSRKKISDGDVLKCELKTRTNQFEFAFCYWSKKTYENALKKAGFKNILWSKAFISDEGLKKYGLNHWKNFLKNPSSIGLTCDK